MPDMEKVIKAVEEAFDLVYSDFIGTDDFNETEWEQNKTDALSLLKEQEAKSIVYKENWMTGLPVATCPKCGRFAQQFHMAHPGEETHFCPWCGQEVKWNG